MSLCFYRNKLLRTQRRNRCEQDTRLSRVSADRHGISETSELSREVAMKISFQVDNTRERLRARSLERDAP